MGLHVKQLSANEMASPPLAAILLAMMFRLAWSHKTHPDPGSTFSVLEASLCSTVVYMDADDGTDGGKMAFDLRSALVSRPFF